MTDLVDLLSRFWSEFATWLSGPLTIRVIILGTVAVLAVREGTWDGRLSRTPYVRAALRSRYPGLLRDRAASLTAIVLFAVAIDLLYQSIEARTHHIAEALIVAILFAVLPYVLIRAVAAGVAARLEHRSRLSNATHGIRHS